MATWYYVEDGQQQGPFDEVQFRQLVTDGRIGTDTLVWNETMSEWQTYAAAQTEAVQAQAEALATGTGQTGAESDVTPLRPAAEEAAPVSSAPRCAECGGEFPADELVPISGRWVCAGCKLTALQKFREGVGVGAALRYAGFWIRFAAKLIDGLVLFAVNMVVGLVVQGIFVGIGSVAGADGDVMGIVGALIGWLCQMAFGLAYTVFFLGRFGATPGKMACSVKVVRSDGTAITYGRALGRYFADMLSSLTLCIGYIIAAFDAEKRALHDHICDTRVVYK
jgi:uncharacterized RDD family membrane protein YckC